MCTLVQLVCYLKYFDARLQILTEYAQERSSENSDYSWEVSIEFNFKGEKMGWLKEFESSRTWKCGITHDDGRDILTFL